MCIIGKEEEEESIIQWRLFIQH